MVRLGDLCEILNGYAFKSQNYTEGGVRIIRISNVQKGYIEDNTPVFYPKDDINAKKYKLYEGDLLLSLTGNVGRVGVLEKKFLPAALNQRVACLRIKDPQILDERYLFNCLNSDLFEEKCILSSKGVAQKNMSTEWLKNYDIPLPSLAIQRKIAMELNKVSALVATYHRQLDLCEDMVKSRFIEMFGDPVKNTMRWEVVTFSEIFRMIKSGLSRKLSDDDIGLPMIRSKNIVKGVLDPSDLKYWHINDPQGADTNEYILDDGDILVNFINSSSQIGKGCIFHDIGRPCIYTTNCFRIKLKSDCNEIYFNSYMMTEGYYRQIQSIIQPAVNQASFTTKNYLQLKIPLPPLSLQNQFEDFVAQVDKSKLAIQKSLEQLETLKKSLMQEYFG